MDQEQLLHAKPTGLITKLFIWIAGADEELLRQCPKRDWDNVLAIAGLNLFSSTYVAALLTGIGHLLYAAPGEIRPDLIAGAVFIAVFLLTIDSYIVNRAGWHLAGIAELKRGGIDVAGGVIVRVKAGFFMLIRLILSFDLSQITALFIVLWIFNTDIMDRVHKIYLQANAALLTAVTMQVDENVRAASDAASAQDKKVETLAAQVTAIRQNAIDPTSNDGQLQQSQQELTQLLGEKAKADEDVRSAETFASNELAGIKGSTGNSGFVGNGPRRKAALEQVAAARARVQALANSIEAARGRLGVMRDKSVSAGAVTRQRSDALLPVYEKTLAGEQGEQLRLRGERERLMQGRDGAIDQALRHAPGYVTPDDGILARLRALDEIGHENPKLATVIILIDVASFGFELAAVLAKVFAWVPTTYAALLAREAYMASVRIVDEMVAELERGPAARKSGRTRPQRKPANDNQAKAGLPGFLGSIFGNTEGKPPEPPQPPKRPRGRPRKTTLN